MSKKHTESASDTAAGVKLTNFTPTNKPGNPKSAYGGILLGYLCRLGNFGIGPELFYNIGKLESKISGRHVDTNPDTYNFDVTRRITDQRGINARFGYFLNSYFLYGLLGLHSQKGNVKIQSTFGNAALNQNYYRTKMKWISKFSFGFGAQKIINESFDIGLEYKTAKFSNKTSTLAVNVGQEPVLTSNFRYRLHTIAVRLIYKF